MPSLALKLRKVWKYLRNSLSFVDPRKYRITRRIWSNVKRALMMPPIDEHGSVRRTNSMGSIFSMIPNWFNGIVRRRMSPPPSPPTPRSLLPSPLNRQLSHPRLDYIGQEYRMRSPPLTPSAPLPAMSLPSCSVRQVPITLEPRLKTPPKPTLNPSKPLQRLLTLSTPKPLQRPASPVAAPVVVLDDDDDDVLEEEQPVEAQPTVNEPLRDKQHTHNGDTLALADLTDAELCERIKFYRNCAPDDVIITKFKLSLKRSCLDLLLDSSWINDEIVNFYMNLIVDRSQRHSQRLPRVHAMSTFFLMRLLLSGYEGVRRWTRGVNLFEMDVIFVPVNEDNEHWSLAVIHLRDKYIVVLDSAGTRNDRLPLVLKHYLQEESLSKRHCSYDMDDFQLDGGPSDIPLQQNLHDCGVFCCTYANFLALDRPFTFSQRDMSYFRKKMYLEIASGTLMHLNESFKRKAGGSN